VTWFSGESRVALFIELLLFTFEPPTGVLGFCDLQQKRLGNPSVDGENPST
jgi:hypothetical protein